MLNVFSLLGVESRFGCGVGKLDWLDNDDEWSITSLDGQDVGHYKGVVASDKNTFSSRFTDLTGKPPPVGKKKSFARILYLISPCSLISAPYVSRKHFS